MTRAIASLPLALSFARVAAGPPPPDRAWFCPGPATLDYIRPVAEERRYSHTQILCSVLGRLQGQTGPSTGATIIRR